MAHNTERAYKERIPMLTFKSTLNWVKHKSTCVFKISNSKTFVSNLLLEPNVKATRSGEEKLATNVEIFFRSKHRAA